MSDNMSMDFEGGLGHAYWRDEAKRLEAENTELRREISGLRDPGGKKFSALMGKSENSTEEAVGLLAYPGCTPPPDFGCAKAQLKAALVDADLVRKSLKDLYNHPSMSFHQKALIEAILSATPENVHGQLTRLTAERDELKAANERLIAAGLRKDAAIAEMDRIGSKALEIAEGVQASLREAIARREEHLRDPSTHWLNREKYQYDIGLLKCFLSPQSEPTCCKPSTEDLASLAAGDYCAEELWGGPRPTCPKCIDYWNQVDKGSEAG